MSSDHSMSDSPLVAGDGLPIKWHIEIHPGGKESYNKGVQESLE